MRRHLGSDETGAAQTEIPYRGFESLPLRQLTIPNAPNLHQSACSAMVYGSESFPSIPDAARRNPEKAGYETG